MKRASACLLMFLSSFHVHGEESKPWALRCDYRTAPLAVDRPDPLLSWRLEGERRGLAQQAYQIQVASGIGKLETPDFWDSGWVNDSRSTAIPYAGKPFSAKQRLHWRVRIKDDRGVVSPWSESTFFDGGLLKEDDWQGADWISCTRELESESAPDDVMGPWIAAPRGKKGSITFEHRFSLPDKPVVYAGTWWNHVDEGEVTLKLNGQKGLSGPEGPATIFYKDFGFQMKPEGNLLSVTVEGADPSTAISVGIKVAFADGTEQLIQSSADWQVETGSGKVSAKMVCKYGAEPLGKAKISPRAPLQAAWYKKDFSVGKSVESARLYVCGLGYNEPYLNGGKVGDHVLDPGQTDYEEFAHYQVFDVKDQLREGGNSLSILLGDGWFNNDRWFSHSRYLYGKPGLRAMLEVRYGDGKSEVVVSDSTWRWKPSGLVSSVFMGDHLDYRQWHDEWKTPGTPAGWLPVKQIKALSPKLIAARPFFSASSNAATTFW